VYELACAQLRSIRAHDELSVPIPVLQRFVIRDDAQHPVVILESLDLEVRLQIGMHKLSLENMKRDLWLHPLVWPTSKF
jgi:hypothetical protein